MAKKDTIKALVNKGVSEEHATKLVEQYTTVTSVAKAHVQEIATYLGVSEDIASDIISHASRRTSGKVVGDMKPKDVMTVQHKEHMCSLTPEEKVLIEAAEKENIVIGKDLPLKVIVDLAKRLAPAKGTDKLGDDKRRQIVAEARNMYLRRRMDRNESAGVMAAQSIGEPGTQMNMRTFHNAGVANLVLTQGLPRLIEIVDARRVPATPSMIIPLEEKIAKDDSGVRQKATEIAYKIETTRLGDIAEIDIDLGNAKLIVTPNPAEMDKRGIKDEDVKEALERVKALRGSIEIKDFNIIVSATDYDKTLPKVHSTLSGMKIKGPKSSSININDVAKVKMDIPNCRVVISCNQAELEANNIDTGDIMKSAETKLQTNWLMSATDTDVTVYPDQSRVYKTLLKAYDAVKDAKIKGIDGVKRAVISKDKSTGLWTIITEGSNLKEVMDIEGVDRYKVTSNSILEVADVLGIEAARNAIIREASETLGEAGLNVDMRHIMLVADLMTNDGTVKAIGRHGISGKKSSVLARAAFEITTPHLLKAAILGEVDELQGVTENIITGQPVTLGTGAINLEYEPKTKGDKK